MQQFIEFGIQSFKQLAPILLILTILSCSKEIEQLEEYIEEPLGGGDGYSRIVLPEDVDPALLIKIHTVEDFLRALNNTGENRVLYIEGEATLNLSGHSALLIPEGWTIAGNRGYRNSKGPLLYTTNLEDEYLLDLRGNNRVTGIRLKGPDVPFEDITYNLKGDKKSSSRAIAFRGRNIEVDNCEIFNFQRNGLDAQRRSGNLLIHHNYLHDIHSYPVFVADASEPPILIEGNKIEWIWHAIAGTGTPGTGYEAAYNMFIRKTVPESWQPYPGWHALDMHPDNEAKRDRNQLIAGYEILIHHNQFMDVSKNDPSSDQANDINIRGIPQKLAAIHDNYFYNELPEKAVVHSGCNVWVYNNYYGQNQNLIKYPLEATPQVFFQNPPPPGIEVHLIETPTFQISFNVNALPSLEIDSVIVELDNRVLFRGDSVPLPEMLEVDIESLEKSRSIHEIKVTAIDSRGVKGRISNYFQYSK